MIDLGPTDGSVQHRLEVAVVAAGLDLVQGDGVEDALAGRDSERDVLQLASAIENAQHAFGELKCGDVTAPARQAIGLAAARQAAGRPVSELARAWALLLLCADRENHLDAALAAAGHLRALGGSPEVPASVLAKYPEIDALANRELIEIDVETEVPGAAIWIDFQRVGVSPLHIELPAGEHVLAAAAGTQRGWAAGRTLRSQKTVRIPLYEVAGPWADVAQRITSWNGKVPAASELAWVLGRVNARVAILRHGDQVEAWGHVGRAQAPHLLGGDDGMAAIDDVARVLALVADRVRTWNAHAPDPDQPLLVEAHTQRSRSDARNDQRTKWWVYAAVLGAAAVGGLLIVANENATDHQRVELRFP